MWQRLSIILVLSISLGLIGGEAASSESAKTEPVPSTQGVQKMNWRSIFTWLTAPQNWWSSGKTTEKQAIQPAPLSSSKDDNPFASGATRQLLPLGAGKRDANDPFKTYLFVRPKPGMSDIGTPSAAPDNTRPAPTQGCAGLATSGNTSDDKKLPAVTDLALGMCLRF